MDLGLGNLSDLKTHLLNAALRTSTDYDTAIAQLGRGVAGRFERHCNRRFGRVAGATFECPADRTHFVLDRYPVESLTTLELRDSLATGWVDQGAVNDLVENISAASGLVTLASRPSTLASARLRATFTGGYWYPGRGAPQTARGTIDLATGAESHDVAFATAFAALPVVRCALVLPDGAAAGMSVWPAAATRAGFRAVFGAPVPAGTKLVYTAIGAALTSASARVQSGLIPLAAGAESVALSFGAAFAAAPQVVPVMVVPASTSAGVTVWPVAITAAGCTFVLGGPVPAAGYALVWIAIGDALTAADNEELQRHTQPLASGDTSAAVSFPLGFAAAPIATAQVLAPDGTASGIEAWPVQATLTGAGVTYIFSAPVPAAGYALHGWAHSTEGLPAGATALPDDLRYAWLLQCENVWALRDALGVRLGKETAGVSPDLTLQGLKFLPEVESILAAYKRYALL